eukprot:754154-Hanusia_phi.AAC.1
MARESDLSNTLPCRSPGPAAAQRTARAGRAGHPGDSRLPRAWLQLSTSGLPAFVAPYPVAIGHAERSELADGGRREAPRRICRGSMRFVGRQIMAMKATMRLLVLLTMAVHEALLSDGTRSAGSASLRGMAGPTGEERMAGRQIDLKLRKEDERGCDTKDQDTLRNEV